LPKPPTKTYTAHTSNAGQQRRQQHKAQRAATKHARKPNQKNEATTTSRPTTRYISNPSKPQKRHGTKITSYTVNHINSVFAEPQPSPTSPPEPIDHSSMPAHAFSTANAVIDPTTGTALEYPQLKRGEDSKL
jgi:hypothetical protein